MMVKIMYAAHKMSLLSIWFVNFNSLPFSVYAVRLRCEVFSSMYVGVHSTNSNATFYLFEIFIHFCSFVTIG